jgi:hypothetical protein
MVADDDGADGRVDPADPVDALLAIQRRTPHAHWCFERGLRPDRRIHDSVSFGSDFDVNSDVDIDGASDFGSGLGGNDRVRINERRDRNHRRFGHWG